LYCENFLNSDQEQAAETLNQEQALGASLRGFLRETMRCFLSAQFGNEELINGKLSELRDKIYDLLIKFRGRGETIEEPISKHQQSHYQQSKDSFAKYLKEQFGTHDNLWDTIEMFLQCDDPTNQCDPAFKDLKKSLDYLIYDTRKSPKQKLNCAQKEITRMELAAKLSKNDNRQPQQKLNVRSKKVINWEDAIDAYLDLQKVFIMKNSRPFSIPDDLRIQMEFNGCAISKDWNLTTLYHISYISNEEQCLQYGKELIHLISEDADLKNFVNVLEGKYRCSNCSSEFFCLTISSTLDYNDYFGFEKDPLLWTNLPESFTHCINQSSCICHENDRESEKMNIFCRVCCSNFPGVSELDIHHLVDGCGQQQLVLDKYCDRCGKGLDLEETYENHHTVNSSHLVERRVLHFPNILQVRFDAGSQIKTANARKKDSSVRANFHDPLYEFLNPSTTTAPSILYKLSGYLTFPNERHWVSTCIENPNENDNVFWRMDDLSCTQVHPYDIVKQNKYDKKQKKHANDTDFYEKVLMEERVVLMVFQKKS